VINIKNIIDVNRFQKMLSDNGSNYYKFAKDTGLHDSSVYRIIKGQASPGAKFIYCLMQWCKKNNYDFLTLLNKEV
jgi:predicted transcriptional regulator